MSQRPGLNSANPRTPSMEGDLHIPFLFVDQLWLRAQEQNSRVPRTLNPLLERRGVLSPRDPFPPGAGRLKSLSARGTTDGLRGITARLSYLAPVLEGLYIEGHSTSWPRRSPTLTAAAFNGVLSSLHELCLQNVHTGLPWRNMINLTSFTLAHIPSGDTSIGQLLDFFRGSPSPPQSSPPLRNPDFWWSKWTIGITGLLEEDGVNLLPLARSPVDFSGRDVDDTRGILRRHSRGSSPQVSR